MHIRSDAISSFLTERITARDFPSAVYAVSEQCNLVLADALGEAVREPVHHPATLNTIFDLASLTKPLVTGLLCAIAVERGDLRLDDRVADYLPEFARTDKAQTTIRQLVAHTSGLPAWRPLYLLTNGDKELTLEAIVSEPLEYEPETRVVYSDLGFITLGLILQRRSGTILADMAWQQIFEPLQLKRTFFNPEAALQTEIAACESQGNAYEREMCVNYGEIKAASFRSGVVWGTVHDGNAHFLGGVAGHAGLFSNLYETLKLAEQFLAGTTELLKPETCELFTTNMTSGLNEARSLGWQLAATPDSTAGPSLPGESFGHTGFTGTSCWVDPKNERIFVLLTNRTHSHQLPFVNINSVRRRFHALAVEELDLR